MAHWKGRQRSAMSQSWPIHTITEQHHGTIPELDQCLSSRTPNTVADGSRSSTAWWFQTLWKYESIGMIILNIRENIKCSKPPTSSIISSHFKYDLSISLSWKELPNWCCSMDDLSRLAHWTRLSLRNFQGWLCLRLRSPKRSLYRNSGSKLNAEKPGKSSNDHMRYHRPDSLEK